ncbi:hypothetical protein [Achromobacter marplatensis]|uniref:hypothetical protein n=1 Tax=Achromobacter marplatensis TaxID=470868 RepID=UPI000277FD7F|nr:hypothetical protein [Achromobacter marplatensis]EJO33515.1 hypothetical protein QWC_00900 [Achromobacter marplatensis]
MKSHKLLLLSALALLPWHAAGAQSAHTTLVAQAAAPQQPMPTADEKTAPANAIGKPVPGARTTDEKKMPSTEETDSRSKAGSAPRQKDPGADTRNGQGTPGGKTGAPDNAGMPGSGASSGSGGGADPR